MEPTKGLEYILNQDGTAYSVSRGTASSKEIVIPSLYRSLPVQSIIRDGFRKIRGLKRVYISENMKYLGKGAFDGCVDLESVSIPGSVEFIDEWAFAVCVSLTNVDIAEGVKTIGPRVFQMCWSLENITFPSTVTSIGEQTFNDCMSLKSVTFQSSEIDFHDKVFEECYKLEHINIPSDTIKIAEGPFSYCHSLSSITIPESVKIIDECAFRSCSSLENINIPDNVITIAKDAFKGCKKLKSIYIPNSVKDVGKNAFWGCINLTITADFDTKPDGWDEAWNPHYRPVIWVRKQHNTDKNSSDTEPKPTEPSEIYTELTPGNIRFVEKMREHYFNRGLEDYFGISKREIAEKILITKTIEEKDQKLLSTARFMKQSGILAEQIAKLTGLSIAEIEKL